MAKFNRNELTKEQILAAMKCETPEELIELAKAVVLNSAWRKQKRIKQSLRILSWMRKIFSKLPAAAPSIVRMIPKPAISTTRLKSKSFAIPGLSPSGGLGIAILRD